MISISVVIPAYNAASTIRMTLDSVLPQLDSQDEVVVVNDGSTDETQSILDSYESNDQVHVYQQDNSGVSSARNHGVRKASGDYVLFLDSDDRLLDLAIKRFRLFVEEHPQCKLVCAGHVARDETGHIRDHSSPVLGSSKEKNFIDYVIRKKFSVTNGAVCIAREVLQKSGFPEALRVSEDFCLYAQILANYPCASFPHATVEVTKRPQSLRHQLELFEMANEQIADTLFDEQVIPENLMKYKQRFVCNRKLSLFRAQYLAGEKDRAGITYRNAIVCRPLNIFKLSYLRKYIRLLID